MTLVFARLLALIRLFLSPKRANLLRFRELIRLNPHWETEAKKLRKLPNFLAKAPLLFDGDLVSYHPFANEVFKSRGTVRNLQVTKKALISGYQCYISSWGAIRESNPFMFGSQPNVFTVSPIAPCRITILFVRKQVKENCFSLRKDELQMKAKPAEKERGKRPIVSIWFKMVS